MSAPASAREAAPSRVARRNALSVTAAGALWGTAGVAGLALGERTGLDPLAVGWYRLAVAALVLLGARALRRGPRPEVARRDLPRVAGVGVLLAWYQVTFFAAVDRAGVALATLVTLGLAPVLVAVATAAAGRERPRAAVLAALVAAIAGLALLVGVPSGGDPADRIPGALLALGSAAGYAGVTLLSRGLAGRVAPGDLTVAGFAVATVALLPLAAASGLSLAAPGAAPPAGTLGLLLYLGAVPTALAYALFFSGLRTTGATAAAVITLVEPLTAAVLAAVLVGERLGPAGLAGGALLLAAVVTLALAPADDPG